MIISAHTVRQLSQREVRTELQALLDGELTGPISDHAAVTIAAWWQAPGTVGAAFAQFASTGEADSTDLLFDVSHSIREAADQWARVELMALFAWITVRMADHDV